MKQKLQIARRLLESTLGRGRFYASEVRCPRQRLGNENAGFTVNPKMLGKSSIIYSFGIGTDISFDLACIELFEAQVEAFDPTPRSIAWLQTQKLPPEFHVHDYGLAAIDDVITLYPPEDQNHVSYSVVERSGNPTICKVQKLSTIMKSLGHQHVDLLKIDIEGAEYEVIENFLHENIPISQICVEFHHRWPQIGKHKTDLAIDLLRKSGYKIFDVSPCGEEFSFLGPDHRCI